MLGLVSTRVAEARAAAPNIYTIAALEPEQLVTHEEILREAFRAMMAGADQLYTIRGPRTVEMLANEGFSVHGQGLDGHAPYPVAFVFQEGKHEGERSLSLEDEECSNSPGPGAKIRSFQQTMNMGFHGGDRVVRDDIQDGYPME